MSEESTFESNLDRLAAEIEGLRREIAQLKFDVEWLRRVPEAAKYDPFAIWKLAIGASVHWLGKMGEYPLDRYEVTIRHRNPSPEQAASGLAEPREYVASYDPIMRVWNVVNPNGTIDDDDFQQHVVFRQVAEAAEQVMISRQIQARFTNYEDESTGAE